MLDMNSNTPLLADSSMAASSTIPMILIDIGARSRANHRGGIWRSAAIDIEGGRTVMSLQAFLRDRDTLLAGGARPVEIDPVYMGTYSLDQKSYSIVPKYQYASMLLRHVWVAIGPSVYMVDFLVVDGAYYDFVLGADFVHKLDGRYPWQRNGEWMVGTSDRSVKLDFSDDVWLKPGQQTRPAPLWRVPAAKPVPPTYNPSYEILTLEAEFLPVFRALDTDHDGFVSCGELRQAMKNPWGGAPLVEAEFRAVWEQVDPYGTGYLNQEQFLQLMGQFRGFFHSPSPYQHAAMAQYRQPMQPQWQAPALSQPQYAMQPQGQPVGQGAPVAPAHGQHIAPCNHCHTSSPPCCNAACQHCHVNACGSYPLTTTTTTTTTTTFAPPPAAAAAAAAQHPTLLPHTTHSSHPQYQTLPAPNQQPATRVSAPAGYHTHSAPPTYLNPATTSNYSKPAKSYVQYQTSPMPSQPMFYSKPSTTQLHAQPATYSQPQASTAAYPAQPAFTPRPQPTASYTRPQPSTTTYPAQPAYSSQLQSTAPYTQPQTSTAAYTAQPAFTPLPQPASRQQQQQQHNAPVVTLVAQPSSYSQPQPASSTQPQTTYSQYTSQPQTTYNPSSAQPQSTYSQYTSHTQAPPPRPPSQEPQRAPYTEYTMKPQTTYSQHQSSNPQASSPPPAANVQYGSPTPNPNTRPSNQPQSTYTEYTLTPQGGSATRASQSQSSQYTSHPQATNAQPSYQPRSTYTEYTLKPQTTSPAQYQPQAASHSQLKATSTTPALTPRTTTYTLDAQSVPPPQAQHPSYLQPQVAYHTVHTVQRLQSIPA